MMLGLLVLLAGCMTTTAPSVVKTYSAIPSTLLDKCFISPPPSEFELLNAQDFYPTARTKMEAQLLMMTEAWFKQTGNLITCDLQIEALKKWDAKHLENRHDSGRNIN